MRQQLAPRGGGLDEPAAAAQQQRQRVQRLLALHARRRERPTATRRIAALRLDSVAAPLEQAAERQALGGVAWPRLRRPRTSRCARAVSAASDSRSIRL